jgi:hypothetical protein
MLCSVEVGVESLAVLVVLALARVRTRQGGYGRCRFPVVWSVNSLSRVVRNVTNILQILVSDRAVLDDRTAWNRLLGSWCPLSEERALRVCIRKITKSKLVLVSW